MPDYSELLAFLAKNPPQIESERQLHASLLELMAQCLRTQTDGQYDNGVPERGEATLEERITESHIRWVNFN